MKLKQTMASLPHLTQLSIAILALAAFSPSLNARQLDSFQVQIKGIGKPLILIPGLSCSGEVWNTTVERYQGKYECHVVTLAGFAEVPPIRHDSFLRQVRDDLIHYIKERSMDRVTLMGHSLGGFLALWIASEIPDQVAKLVIVDGLPFLPAIYNPYATAEGNRQMAAQMRKTMANQPKAQRRNSLRQTLETMITDNRQLEQALDWGMASDPATVAQAMSEMFTTDLRDTISKIQAPSLVMGAWIAYRNFGATHDNTLERYEQQFAKLAGTQIWLTDIGKHFIMWDDPKGYFQKLASFLD